MQPVPPGTSLEFQSEISIFGLDSGNEETANGIKRLVFEGLVTLPGQADNPFINQEAITLNLKWEASAVGQLEGGVVNLDGIGSFPLLLAPGSTPCTPGGLVYNSQLIGVAVAQGPISGRIEAFIGDTLYFKNIQINTIDGPTWFDSEQSNAYVQPVNIGWAATEVSIKATELPKMVDASNNITELDVGQVDNDNQEEATVVSQIFRDGAGGITRQPDLNVTVFNEGGDLPAKKVTLAGTRTAFAEERVFSGYIVTHKGTRDDLLNNPDEPDFSLNGKQATDHFRQWQDSAFFVTRGGVPPIAAATLGADLQFLVELLVFGYIDTTTSATVLVNSITEPSSSIILDAFFDFSAVFGLVSANMTASPQIKVGMPLIVTDSLFNAAESNPCFQFLLELMFQVSVGPCPLCVGASFSDIPIDESAPQGCSLLTKGAVEHFSKQLTSTPPITDSLDLATNGSGLSFAIMNDTDGIHVQQVLGGFTGPDLLLDTGPGAMQPAIEFYDTNAAVAVWAQSSLSQAEYDLRVAADYDCDIADVAADPNCNDQEQFNETAFQHLVYATWDGMAWGATQILTPPTTGEGGVQIVACKASDPLCPTGGEILAVWHRDMAANLSAHQIKLYYAVFDGVFWSAPTAIDPVSTAKDVQPAPLYRFGEPMVIWVRNPAPLDSGGGLVMSDRQLAYQFLNMGAGTQVMPNMPDTVASPSVEVAGDGTIVMSFTSSTSSLDNLPFVGARRALYSAIGIDCHVPVSGVCKWFSLKQLDQHGRSIYVEHPKVVLGANESVNVLYRWLGTDGNLLPGDPFGTLGYGDTAMHALALPEISNSVNAYVNAITADGNVNWNTAAVYDPAIDGILALSGQGNQLAQLKSQASKRGIKTKPVPGVVRQKMSTSRPLTLFKIPSGADLTISSLSAGGVEHVVANDVLAVRVDLANQGQPLTFGETTTVEIWWSGPPGLGTLLHRESNIVLTDAMSTIVELSVDVPSDVVAELPQLMHAVVNSDRDVLERDTTNNQAMLTFNALPVPQNLSHMLDLAGTTVLLDWDDPIDSRITHYRVYRRDFGADAVIQVGLSPRSGFVDVLARPDDFYEYCVASITRAAVESPCSEWYSVAVEEVAPEGIFKDNFES